MTTKRQKTCRCDRMRGPLEGREKWGGVLERKKTHDRGETYKNVQEGKRERSLRDEIFEMVKEIVSVEAGSGLGCAASSRLWGRVLSRWPGSLVPACFMALTACQ